MFGHCPEIDYGTMFESFGRRAVTARLKDSHGGPVREPDERRRTRSHLIDWSVTRLADRACCCPAPPIVVAVMPPSTGRPFPTDLLFCGHHYRASRRSLAAVGAVILDMNGRPFSDNSLPANLTLVGEPQAK